MQWSDRNGERVRVVLFATVIGSLLSLTAVAQTVDNDPAQSTALCAPDDPNPEPGIQGDVPSGTTPAWDCGVQSIGFLEGANGAMAVAGTCAYTGTGAPIGPSELGVRVIDVSDPTNPVLVRILETGSRELLAAEISGDRALLATRHRDTEMQDGQVLGRDVLVDIWDIHECTDPQLLGTVRVPPASDVLGDIPLELAGPAHNLRFNPSATKLYGSLPPHEIDLADLDDPDSWTVRNLHCIIVDQHDSIYTAIPGLCDTLEDAGLLPGSLPTISHEPTFSPDGTRLYIGSQVPAPNSNDMWVLDMTGPDPVVLSVTENTPGHSIDFVTVGGREYLLHSNEIGGTACIPEDIRPNFVGLGDRAWLLDITDETAPSEVSEIILSDSTFASCAPDNLSGPNTAYHDVDDPLETTYAVIGFGPAGFRFFDLRDPTSPSEIAYFNHGASEHTKPYVIPETGHIWVSNARGFWVLDLEPQVRQVLATPLAAGGNQPDAAVDPVESAVPESAAGGRGRLPATGMDAGLLVIGAGALLAAIGALRLRRPRA